MWINDTQKMCEVEKNAEVHRHTTVKHFDISKTLSDEINIKRRIWQTYVLYTRKIPVTKNEEEKWDAIEINTEKEYWKNFFTQDKKAK